MPVTFADVVEAAASQGGGGGGSGHGENGSSHNNTRAAFDVENSMPVSDDIQDHVDDDEFQEHGAPGRDRNTIRATVFHSEEALDNWKSEKFTQVNRFHRNPLFVLRDMEWSWYSFCKYTFWTAWALLLMTVLGTSDLVFKESNPTCPTGYENSNAMVCYLGETFMAGYDELKFLSSFILAGFVASSRALWLTRRSAYCALCGSTRNLLINLNSLVPPSERKLMSRWAILGYELSVLKARFLIDSKEGKEYLEKARLVTDNEWKSMVNGDRHTTAWFWVQTKAKQLKDNGSITDYELQTICNAVTLSRDKANDLMSPIDRDQPPPYVTVCALLINLTLFFYSTAKGFQWGVWAHDAGGWSIWTEPRIYLSILVELTFTIIYAMLFDVSAKLYNPFGPRDIDIPHYLVGTGIRNLAKSLSKTEDVVPKTMNESKAQDSFNTLTSSTNQNLEDMDFNLATAGVLRANMMFVRQRKTRKLITS